MSMLRVIRFYNGGSASRYYGLELSRREKGAKDFLSAPKEEEGDKRISGYDFVFSVPKSVSLYLLNTGDKKVESIIEQSTQKTLNEIERSVRFQDFTGNDNSDRKTGSFVCAVFVHKATYPMREIIDPHFHIHAFIMNITHDFRDNSNKEIDFQDLLQRTSAFLDLFNSTLSRSLTSAGYPIRNVGRSFEMADVPQNDILKFSKRTRSVECLARNKWTSIRE
jgi:conjugative relaxase-like TrwC/TraI family protein